MKNWEKNIRRVEPYVPGEQPKVSDVVKLNTNENPYPPSKKAFEACEKFNCDKLRLYPDPDVTLLVESLADYYKLDKNQVFVGVGSDDVISMAFLTFFNSSLPILFPDISYSFYSVWADVYKIPYKTVPVDEKFKINSADYNQPNGGIIFPNPNAPTSICKPLDEVEEIIKNNQDSVVIVDEAYIDFGGESAMKLIDKYENLLVVQTFSKSRSMAGLRVGFAVGNKDLIKAMNDVKFSINSYTMNQTAILFGSEAVKDKEYFEEGVAKIIATRENAKKKLSEFGFTFPDSKSNFLFVTHESVKASVIFEELKKKNIYVRYFNKARIDNYLRITIGTDEEMEKLYNALEQILRRN